MPESLHVVLPTDVFPPRAGGAGWSAHALSRALIRRGHRVTAIVPRVGATGITRGEVDGVPVVEAGYSAPNVPFVQNYHRFELLWPLLRNVIVAESLRDRSRAVIIHAQHAQTAPAAVLAGRELGAPVVATIRDAWPWHYFATGLLGDRLPFATQNAATLWLDLIGRLGPIKGVLAAPAIPYMSRHVRRRAALLAEADAVIAVSRYTRQRLAGIVDDSKLHVIPNLIDFEAIHRVSIQNPKSEIQNRFLLFAGKLEHNKGAHLLPAALLAARDSGADLPPLVIAGAGELESSLRAELTTHGLAHQFAGGWVEHDEVLRLMRHAEVLLFPSAWGEPLSRVLLEASAAGACIAAIETGGTGDIIEHESSGVLARDEIELGRALADLLHDSQRRARLRAGAERVARERFAADVVAAQVEALYQTMRETKM
jgi:glycogen synthase